MDGVILLGKLLLDRLAGGGDMENELLTVELKLGVLYFFEVCI